MIDRTFEKFRGGPNDKFNTSTKLRATINRKGMIYFNSKLYQAMGSPKAVALYYNREQDIIAIEPATDNLAECFPVVRKQSGWAIHASTFCRHFRIRVALTQSFIRPTPDTNQNIHLNLRETTTVGGLTRERKAVTSNRNEQCQ